MTYLSTAPATKTTARFSAVLAAIKDRIDRFSLPARLERMSDHQLQDGGLIRSDADWLRSQGSSQDAATRLSIQAGMRAGNW